VLFRSPPVVVRIDAGGTTGHYQGALAGTRCGSDRGCDVEWPGNPKIITLHRDGHEAIAASEELPYGEPGEGPPPRVHEVSAEGAAGTLTCDGHDRKIAGERLVWKEGVQHVGPVVLQAGGLGLEVRSDGEPLGAAPSVATRVGLGAGGVVLLAALFLLARRRSRRGQREAPPAVRLSPDGAVDVFFCYALEDEALLLALEKHLHPLVKGGELRPWSSRRIGAGGEMRREVDARLGAAKVIVLLVSADLLGSDYLNDVEVKRAMERQAAGTARVIPVILGPCMWEDAPFGALKPLPANGKPVTEWESRDKALAEIARALRDAVREPLLAATDPR
jgi:hypothetical protein